jgi:hypothetical protein
MFGIPDLFLSPDLRKRQAEWRKKERARRLKECVPWDPKMKWAEELNLIADTYQALELFPGLCSSAPYNINRLNDEQHIDSPDGKWRYVVSRLSRGEKISTVYAAKHGSVLFDGDVRVPALYKRSRIWPDRFDDKPYMSLTPMEMFTLRGGTRRAKGDVILAGLGLGHQLIEVSKRKKVKRLRIIEINQVLVDWLWPHIEPHLQMPVEVIVGNAYKLIPETTADVVLLDTFKGYGSNHYERDDLRRACGDRVGFIWAWGACDLSGGW